MSILAEVWRRQPVLAALGLVYLALMVPALVGIGLDPRTVDGVGTWVKPAKFLASLAVFCLTMAWFFGYVAESVRKGGLARATVGLIIAASVFEMAYIAWQAHLAQASHFHISDTFPAVMYTLMGVGAVTLVSTTLPLAWLIARHPMPDLEPAFRDAVLLGLILTFGLGGGLGGYMSAQLTHNVGAPGTGPGLPLFGWSMTSGDMRPPHFLGIHAQQILPVAAAVLRMRGRWGRMLVWVGALAYAALTLVVFAQALRGEPLLQG